MCSGGVGFWRGVLKGVVKIHHAWIYSQFLPHEEPNEIWITDLVKKSSMLYRIYIFWLLFVPLVLHLSRFFSRSLRERMNLPLMDDQCKQMLKICNEFVRLQVSYDEYLCMKVLLLLSTGRKISFIIFKNHKKYKCWLYFFLPLVHGLNLIVPYEVHMNPKELCTSDICPFTH